MTDSKSTHKNDIEQIRDNIQSQLMHQYDSSATECLDSDAWWLLGTTGCHLCDEAEQMLRLFTNVNPIPIQKVDIADLETTLMKKFASHIPVILTPTTQLNYPFSLVDLQALN